VILVLLTAAVVAVFALGFAVLFRGLFSRDSDSAHLAEWLDDFSLDTYRPMERLLNEEDYRFLERQPGYQPAIARQLRAERKRIFRAYLRQLARDFGRLVSIGELIMVGSQQDRTDLARTIASAQRQFYWNIACVEVSLVVPFRTGSPQIAQLIGAMETMRGALIAPELAH
jgi:hypothetical protein